MRSADTRQFVGPSWPRRKGYRIVAQQFNTYCIWAKVDRLVAWLRIARGVHDHCCPGRVHDHCCLSAGTGIACVAIAREGVAFSARAPCMHRSHSFVIGATCHVSWYPSAGYSGSTMLCSGWWCIVEVYLRGHVGGSGQGGHKQAFTVRLFGFSVGLRKACSGAPGVRAIAFSTALSSCRAAQLLGCIFKQGTELRRAYKLGGGYFAPWVLYTRRRWSGVGGHVALILRGVRWNWARCKPIWTTRAGRQN